MPTVVSPYSCGSDAEESPSINLDKPNGERKLLSPAVAQKGESVLRVFRDAQGSLSA
jgi:hypothetical protein